MRNSLLDYLDKVSSFFLGVYKLSLSYVRWRRNNPVMLQKLADGKLSDLIFCLGDSNLNLRDSNPLLDFTALDSNPISGDSNP